MATDASDRDLTENGVTFREKVMALNTVTTVKACGHRRQQRQLSANRRLAVTGTTSNTHLGGGQVVS